MIVNAPLLSVIARNSTDHSLFLTLFAFSALSRSLALSTSITFYTFLTILTIIYTQRLQKRGILPNIRH